MIHKVGQIMLYVNNQDEAVRFWIEKVGFHLVADENNGQGFRWIEIAPTEKAETSIVLHNKELIAKMQPELNLSTPSMLFFTEDIDKLYKEFVEKEITVGEIVNMPSGRAFNFADHEKNYFAIMKKK
ncbi:VOC family protein [Bacillus sp. XF8]|uniref:VOC family protein n=1 Tax=Bacillus sp. XF8 TaxID=2819289 RepID=UPI001AA01817|nr:VOC family protein [Bacillus sp. XF8]MBO1580495.1 VOC family protein [Bacillus sp. XF8]